MQNGVLMPIVGPNNKKSNDYGLIKQIIIKNSL